MSFVDRLRPHGLVAAMGLLIFSASSANAQTCDQTLSAGANVGSAISSAAAGTTICLNNGNYSGFTLNNVVKSPRVTVRAVNSKSASFTGGISILGNTNGVTFDGVNFAGVSITGSGAANLTFKNADASKGSMHVDYVTTAVPNILYENLTHYNQDNSGFCWSGTVNCIGAAAYALPGPPYRGSNTNPVITIRGAIIDGGCADGIQFAVPIVIENSIIKNKRVGSCINDPHTDATQLYGGTYTGSIIRNNYYYNNDQVIGAYDGVDGVLLENNVFDPGTAGRQCQIELYADNASIVRNNTVIERGGNGYICLDRKSNDPAGVKTQVYNNIALGLTMANGSTASVNTKNLFPGGGGTNVAGSPTFSGACAGAVSTAKSWTQCALAAGSAGKNAGTDGKDVGTNYYGITVVAPTNLTVK